MWIVYDTGELFSPEIWICTNKCIRTYDVKAKMTDILHARLRFLSFFVSYFLCWGLCWYLERTELGLEYEIEIYLNGYGGKTPWSIIYCPSKIFFVLWKIAFWCAWRMYSGEVSLRFIIGLYYASAAFFPRQAELQYLTLYDWKISRHLNGDFHIIAFLPQPPSLNLFL